MMGIPVKSVSNKKPFQISAVVPKFRRKVGSNGRGTVLAEGCSAILIGLLHFRFLKMNRVKKLC